MTSKEVTSKEIIVVDIDEGYCDPRLITLVTQASMGEAQQPQRPQTLKNLSEPGRKSENATSAEIPPHILYAPKFPLYTDEVDQLFD